MNSNITVSTIHLTNSLKKPYNLPNQFNIDPTLDEDMRFESYYSIDRPDRMDGYDGTSPLYKISEFMDNSHQPLSSDHLYPTYLKLNEHLESMACPVLPNIMAGTINAMQAKGILTV